MNTGGPSGGLGPGHVLSGGLGQPGMGGFRNGGVGLGLGMPVTNSGFGGLSSGPGPGPGPGLDHGAGAPGTTSGGGENGSGMGGIGVTFDMYQSFMHRSGEGGQGQ
jgi:hypothetical protein